MKADSIQGILMARFFLVMYEEDGNKMNDNLKQILFLLNNETIRLIRRTKINAEKQVALAYNKMESIVGEDDAAVQAVPFALRLIIRNPNADKYKKLVKLALKEDKLWKFVKDKDVKQAKRIVDKFYGVYSYENEVE